jgi:hypothetical protein
MPRHPVGEHSGSKPLRYEPPALVRLGSLQTTLAGGGSELHDFDGNTCVGGSLGQGGC